MEPWHCLCQNTSQPSNLSNSFSIKWKGKHRRQIVKEFAIPADEWRPIIMVDK
jgi:hypothetical protein